MERELAVAAKMQGSKAPALPWPNTKQMGAMDDDDGLYNN